LITNKRSIKTTILADEGETIVLGGLIQDDYTDIESKVPILGDIPLIGRLFKSQERSRVKRNLLVFLRPTIVRNRDTLREVTQRKYNHIREIELDVSGDGLFKFVEAGSDFSLPEDPNQIYIKSQNRPK